MSLESYGDHLKAVRLDRGLLQREVTKIIGCSHETIVNW